MRVEGVFMHPLKSFSICSNQKEGEEKSLRNTIVEQALQLTRRRDHHSFKLKHTVFCHWVVRTRRVITCRVSDCISRNIKYLQWMILQMKKRAEVLPHLNR